MGLETLNVKYEVHLLRFQAIYDLLANVAPFHAPEMH